MAIVKLSPGESIRYGKHAGSCVQSSSQGITLKNNAHVRKFRSPVQLNRQLFMMHCVRAWRTLDSSIRELWNLWAATYPQPTIENPALFCSGYELFVKRNYYLFLSSPDSAVIMSSPIFFEYAFDDISYVVYRYEEALTIDLTFDLSDSNLDVILFLSNEVSPGLKFGDTRWRYLATVPNLSAEIDVTEAYLNYFGHLPDIGEKVFLSVVQVGHDNAQFTYHQLSDSFIQVKSIPILSINGLLYPFSTVINSLFAPPGWRVPTLTDWSNLQTNIGGYSNGGRLKESGLVYWESPNTGATNNYLWNGRGSGRRDPNGSFVNSIRGFFNAWSSTPNSATTAIEAYLSYNNGILGTSFTIDRRRGCSVRLIKNDSSDPLSMSDYDGNVYPTVKIASQVWTAYNWKCQHLTDGYLIPEITSDYLWGSTTLELCAYSNDWSNV